MLLSESLNRMEIRVFLLSQIHVGIRLEDVLNLSLKVSGDLKRCDPLFLQC